MRYLRDFASFILGDVIPCMFWLSIIYIFLAGVGMVTHAR